MGHKDQHERYQLWIDRKQKVISFLPVEGAEERSFRTWEQLFRLAMTYAKDEYRFQ